MHLLKNIQALFFMGLLLGLSACGTIFGTSAAVQGLSGNPDRVNIAIDRPTPDPTQRQRVVTLTLSSLVQQLYTTTFALPPMPQQTICTLEGGPHYTLTFRQEAKTLATVVAKREGCYPVSIAGETTDRQATQHFWDELDQAIQKAHPAARSLVCEEDTKHPELSPILRGRVRSLASLIRHAEQAPHPGMRRGEFTSGKSCRMNLDTCF